MYRTLTGPSTHEIPKIKGSRFIADVAPAADEEEARAFVHAIRKQHHAARHVCWAYVLGEEGEVSRSSDDGEPSGSAGKPILAAITGAELTYVVVAVTRYFGGTKLGVGGLVRAYGGAAAEGLAGADVREVVPTREVVAVVPYGLLQAVQAHGEREGLEARAEYTDDVRLTFDVPVERAEGFAAEIVDLTAGQVVPELGEVSETAR